MACKVAYHLAQQGQEDPEQVPRTLYDKIFEDHTVDVSEDGTALLFVDRHLVHEVTSPQAFEGLRNAGRPVRRTDCTLATVDHNVPTSDRESFDTVENFIKEADSRTQVLALEKNVKEFGVTYFGMDDARQGIVHVIGPEQGEGPEKWREGVNQRDQDSSPAPSSLPPSSPAGCLCSFL